MMRKLIVVLMGSLLAMVVCAGGGVASSAHNKATVYYSKLYVQNVKMSYSFDGKKWTVPTTMTNALQQGYAVLTIELGQAKTALVQFTGSKGKDEKRYTIRAGTFTVENGTVIVGAPESQKLIWPVAITDQRSGIPIVRVSSPFGMRTHPVTGEQKMHQGIDIPPKRWGVEGDHILAVQKGRIIVARMSKTYGNVVYMNSFIHGQYVQVRYAHLQDKSIRVQKDQWVNSGDLIGQMGNTGVSSGIHLHFETRVADAIPSDINIESSPIDPLGNYYVNYATAAGKQAWINWNRMTLDARVALQQRQQLLDIVIR